LYDGVFGYVIKCPIQENGKRQKHGSAPDGMFFMNPPQVGENGSSPAGRRTRDDISAISIS
jgi:hypothetical protein